MKEKIESLRAEIESAIGQTETGRALYELKVKFQTSLKDIMGGMKNLPKEEKPLFGKVVNEFKQNMEAQFEARAVVVKEMELKAQYEKERIDITMPGKSYKAGALHPITLVKNELIDIFSGMGFEVFEGPEIEPPSTRLRSEEICRTPSIWRIIFCSARRRPQGRFALWNKRRPPLKFSRPVVYSVRTTTQPIRPCSIRWKDWL